MAKAATKESVAADMKPADYRGAIKRMAAIPNKTTKQQKIAKEIGDVFSAVEAICGVNKPAAKIYMSLTKLEEPERITVMRDLNGMIDAAGWPRQAADLVDQAQDNVVQMRVGDGADADEVVDEVLEEIAATEDPEDFEMSDEELAAQKTRPSTEEADAKADADAENAKLKKPSHSDVEMKPVPDAPGSTDGDNSDLVQD